MLKLYDYLDEVLAINKISQAGHTQLKYYASELGEKLGYENNDDFNYALSRTFEICNSLHIPLTQNFKRVYRYDGGKLFTHWKLSSLACYLFVLNGDPHNPVVAKA